MRHWTVVIPADRFDAERVYGSDVLELAEAPGLAPGDRVALVAALQPPAVFALGEVTTADGGHDPDSDDPDPATDGAVAIAYTARFLDAPVPFPGAAPTADVAPLDAAVFEALRPPPGRTVPARTWLVSLDLPIEADSAAEAARRFWGFVRDLGPRELPTFVSPTGNEMAMQALVGGQPVNLDPEED